MVPYLLRNDHVFWQHSVPSLGAAACMEYRSAAGQSDYPAMTTMGNQTRILLRAPSIS